MNQSTPLLAYGGEAISVVTPPVQTIEKKLLFVLAILTSISLVTSGLAALILTAINFNQSATVFALRLTVSILALIIGVFLGIVVFRRGRHLSLENPCL